MAVAIARKYFSFDRKNAFADDLTMTASGRAQLSSADVELNMGEGYYEGVLVIDISAIDTASSDEAYTFVLEGCNTTGFGSGNIEQLAYKRIEHASSSGTVGRQNITHAAGRYYIPFMNQQGGAQYQYLTLNVVIGGTTPSVTFSAWVASSSQAC
jgi:hypothetical protein